MSERLHKLAEIVLDRVYTYGYQQRTVEEEKIRADDDLLAAQRKLADVTAFGDKVIAERDKLSAEIETLREKLRSANGRVDLANMDNASLQKKLAAAGDPAELERLRAFVDCVRNADANYEWPGFYTRIKDALAALDATNPAPVSEPRDDNAELERLREFVGKVMQAHGGFSCRLHPSNAKATEDFVGSVTRAIQSLRELENANPAPASETEGGAE